MNTTRGMTGAAVGAAALLVGASGVARADFHLDVDVQYTQMTIDFIGTGDVVGAALPEGVECPPDVAYCNATPTALHFDALRGTAGVGFGVLTLEGTVTHAVGGSGYGDLGAGVRFDTGTGVFAFQFRLGYLKRWGDLAGEGGNAGVGVVIRPFNWVALYGEARGEASTVPASMMEMGVPVALAWSTGGGLRFSFGL